MGSPPGALLLVLVLDLDLVLDLVLGSCLSCPPAKKGVEDEDEIEIEDEDEEDCDGLPDIRGQTHLPRETGRLAERFLRKGM